MRDLAIRVLDILENNGYEASLVGGSIRNELHNKYHNGNLPIKDYDITTNAAYNKMSKMFKTIDTRGEQFKVAVVKFPIQNVEFEVAQYRGESYPEGGSLRPDVVYAVKSLKEDVMRRDFTMNGIAEDRKGNIIDHVGGVEDIKNKVIRAIGDAEQRFAEDPLRMLRALRFVSQLGYDIERDTADAIVKNLHRLSKIPHERVKEEINKLLRGKNAVKALRLMRDMGFQKYDFYNSILKQNVRMFVRLFYLKDSVFENVMDTFSKIDRKNATLSDIYFVLYKHTEVEKAKAELNNTMFLNNDDIFRVVILLDNFKMINTKILSSIVGLIKDVGEQRGIEYLSGILNSYKVIYDANFDHLEEVLKRPLFKYQLPINGNDIIEEGKKMGITKPGKWINSALTMLQAQSISGQELLVRQAINSALSGAKG